MNTLFGAGLDSKKLIRYDIKRERLVCQSRLEIPRVDSIKEDAHGSLWVFSFGKEKKIFEFSPKLTLITHYPIESRRDISKFYSSNMNFLRKLLTDERHLPMVGSHSYQSRFQDHILSSW